MQENWRIQELNGMRSGRCHFDSYEPKAIKASFH